MAFCKFIELIYFVLKVLLKHHLLTLQFLHCGRLLLFELLQVTLLPLVSLHAFWNIMFVQLVP